MLTAPQNPAAGLASVRDRITVAARAAGRAPGSVTLIGVCKSQPLERVRAALDAGLADLGENYLQEARAHFDALAGRTFARHFIGPLQSNKSREVASHFDWVHTVDRPKIAERLSAQRPAGLAPLQVCIQVNIDGGPTKAGVPPEAALELARVVAKLPRLTLRGLMAIPDHAPEYIAQLSIHKSAKAIFDQISALREPGLEHFDTLSLGMTADLEAAVQAGSTMVRVGTGIFGGRTYAVA